MGSVVGSIDGESCGYLLAARSECVTWTLLLYDSDGDEIGWLRAIHDESLDSEWQEPYAYEWELTHSEPEEWEQISRTLRSYADPVTFGSVDVIETEQFTMNLEGLVRLDDDGPEGYLQEAASVAAEKGVAQTEIHSE